MFIYDNYDVPPLVFIYVVKKKKNRPIIAHNNTFDASQLSSSRGEWYYLSKLHRFSN